MKTNKNTILALVLGLLSIFALQKTALLSSISAQGLPNLDISVTPPVEYVFVEPGETISHAVVVEYKGTEPVQVIVEVVDFTPDDLTGAPILSKTNSFPHIQLVDLSKSLGKPFPMKPNSRENLIFKLSPPLHAVVREYPLTILFTAIPDLDLGQDISGAKTTGALGSNLIVFVSSEKPGNSPLEIEKVTAPIFIDSFEKLSFRVVARNQASSATVAHGEATIHNWRGKEIKKFYIYPDAVLGKSTRPLRAAKSDPTTLDLNSVDPNELIPLNFEYQAPFLIGPYTFRVTLNNSVTSEGQPKIVSTKVIALPFAVVIIGSLSLIIYVIFRLRNQKK